MEFLIVFSNTHQVLSAEKLLIEHHISVKTIPLPAVLKSGCGFCLVLAQKDISTGMALLQQHKIEGILYEKHRNEKGTTYHLCKI